MFHSKKGEKSTIEFLIGLILFGLTLFALAMMVRSCVKLDDSSGKSFDKLALFLDDFSKPETALKSDSQFVTIKDDELLLFFNKGEKYFLNVEDNRKLTFYHLELKTVSIYDYSSILSSFLKVRSERSQNKVRSGLTFFEKPSDCGDDACVVLCNKFKGNVPIDSRSFISENFKYITSDFIYDAADTMKIISCSEIKKIKILPDVDKFYRKIYSLEYYETSDGKKPKYPIQISDGSFKYNSAQLLYDGSFLFSAISQFDYQPFIKENSADNIKLFHENYPFEDTFRPALWEVVDNTKSEFVTLLKTSAVYFQKYGSDSIVMCYSPPCITIEDELYNKLESQIASCLTFPDAASDGSSGDCSVLSESLMSYAKNDKLTLKKSGDTLSVLYGKNDFSFTKAVEFWIIPDINDGTKTISAQEVSLNYDSGAATTKIKLDANGVSYSLVKINSEKGPKLNFIVTPYNPPS